MRRKGLIFWAFLGLIIYSLLYLVQKNNVANSYPAIIDTIIHVGLDGLATFLCFEILINKKHFSNRNVVFLRILLTMSTLMMLVNFSWGVSVNIFGITTGAQHNVFLNRIPYLLVLLMWVIFWAIHLNFLSVKIPLLLTCGIVTLALSLGLTYLFWNYVQDFRIKSHSLQGAFFVYTYVGLELFGLILCMAASTVGKKFPTWIGSSYIILCCTDLFYNAYEITGTLSKYSMAEILWTISQVLLVLGILFHFRQDGKEIIKEKVRSVRLFVFSLPIIISICFSVFIAILLSAQKDLQIATILIFICGLALAINITIPFFLPHIIHAFEYKQTKMQQQLQTILFLAANPSQTSSLDLEEELHLLETELRGVANREKINLVSHHAVRPDDLIRHIRKYAPTVVHFSGHGNDEGIILRDEKGGWVPVSGHALQRFFKDRGVKLVVLNSCFSTNQAKKISLSVPAVVGTISEVEDLAAQKFTVAFYRSLGDGLTIEEAFRDGGDAIELYGLKDVFESIGLIDTPIF